MPICRKKADGTIIVDGIRRGIKSIEFPRFSINLLRVQKPDFSKFELLRPHSTKPLNGSPSVRSISPKVPPVENYDDEPPSIVFEDVEPCVKRPKPKIIKNKKLPPLVKKKVVLKPKAKSREPEPERVTLRPASPPVLSLQDNCDPPLKVVIKDAERNGAVKSAKITKITQYPASRKRNATPKPEPKTSLHEPARPVEESLIIPQAMKLPVKIPRRKPQTPPSSPPPSLSPQQVPQPPSVPGGVRVSVLPSASKEPVCNGKQTTETGVEGGMGSLDLMERNKVNLSKKLPPVAVKPTKSAKIKEHPPVMKRNVPPKPVPKVSLVEPARPAEECMIIPEAMKLKLPFKIPRRKVKTPPPSPPPSPPSPPPQPPPPSVPGGVRVRIFPSAPKETVCNGKLPSAKVSSSDYSPARKNSPDRYSRKERTPESDFSLEKTPEYDFILDETPEYASAIERIPESNISREQSSKGDGTREGTPESNSNKTPESDSELSSPSPPPVKRNQPTEIDAEDDMDVLDLMADDDDDFL